MVEVKSLVEAIVKALVDYPEQVLVTEVEGTHSCVLELSVAPDDVGKVIGKKGIHADAIRRIVEFTFTYYLEHEGFVRLVVAENQARGRHFRKSKAMRSLNRPIIETLARVLARGQADGSFRADANAVEVHMAIAALGLFNVTNQYTFGAIFQCDMGATGDVGRRRELVAEVILGYLTNRG